MIFAAGAENMIPGADPPNTVAINNEARGYMDQYQAWRGIDPAGPARETWNEAAQDAVSAGLAAWVTDCIAMAISWSTASAFISRTRSTGHTDNRA